MKNIDSILDSMREGILLLDDKGKILKANQALKDVLKPTGSLIDIGKNICDVDIDTDFYTIIREALASPGEREVELELAEKPASLLVTFAPISTDSSFNILMIVKNITKQRELDNIRRDFIANVSHELKTPITGIKLLADAINQSPDSEIDVIKHFAQRLGKETGRLIQLVNDLLDLSKLETVEPKFEYFDLSGLLRELGEEFKLTAENKGISLQVFADSGLPQYLGNPEQMELMIVNLLDNAIRYTLANGSVDVRLVLQGKNFMLEIADSGIGIPKKDLARIFERFYRVDKARSRKKGGTGLGLSIVKHVVQNHRGDIKVESQTGSGSKFIVFLPLNIRSSTSHRA